MKTSAIRKSIPLWKGIGLALLLLFLLRGVLYRAIVKYEIIGEREITQITNKELHHALQTRIEGETLDPEKIIAISRRLTDSHLSFTTGKAALDADGVYRTGRANCIGYAALFAAIVDDIIQEQ